MKEKKKVLKVLIHQVNKKTLECGRERSLKTKPYTKQKNTIFVQTFRCAVALWKSSVRKYSIRFQVIKLKLLCVTLKIEK